MLGNFSIGQYFKQGAAEFAWDLSLNGFGFNPDDIWITVLEGDDALASALTRRPSRSGRRSASRGRGSSCCPARRTSGRRGRQARAGRAASSTSTAVWNGARPTTCPGGDNERFLEYWNLVFMQYDQDPIGTLTPLPSKNIDTGLGLNRMAMIQQGVDSIFETDQFLPLMTLGREPRHQRAR